MVDFNITGLMENGTNAPMAFSIKRDDNGGYSVWLSGKLRDDLDNDLHFVDKVGGIYYPLKDAAIAEEPYNLSNVLLYHVLSYST